jgi:hypothetical protein
VSEREIDRLYALPLAEFTHARNELAKSSSGEDAKRVKALAKPTVAAWAVNQLARGNEVQMRALLRAGDRLREAQRKALAGKGSDTLREAQRAEREAVTALVRQAESLLPGASRQMLDRIGETLRAAALDEEARDLLKRGRLTRELESPGFGLLEGMPTRAAPKRDERRKRVAAARERVKELRAAAREAERQAARAEREAAQARDAADKAAAELADAEEELAALD